MKLYRFHAVQTLPVPLDEAWRFFSDPRNLDRITPPRMRLAPTSPVPDRMHAGLIVTYRVRPLGLREKEWVSEITALQEPYYFVDEQCFGPYRFWHHQHHFRAVKDGVEVRDLVHYALPYGPVGELAHALVRQRLAAIFRYRRHALARMFGEVPPPPAM